MIIRELAEARSGDRHVVSEGWRSTRLLLRGDGMGFSFHITEVDAGAELAMHYTNHLEAVYCIEGEGTIEDLAAGAAYAIGPGVLYALDKHDRHVLRAATPMTFACVFNPPVTGREVHDEDGSYPLETA